MRILNEIARKKIFYQNVRLHLHLKLHKQRQQLQQRRSWNLRLLLLQMLNLIKGMPRLVLEEGRGRRVSSFGGA